MRVVVTGATGFIGQALCRHLHGDYELVALSRNIRKAAAKIGAYARIVHWDGRDPRLWASEVSGARAVVNLAGENIAAWRWSRSKKTRIRESRIQGAKAVAEAIAEAQVKPDVLIHGSAVGYYGLHAHEVLDEYSPGGDGFLAEVCRDAETIAMQSQALDVRCVIVRSGIVLGADGGALPNLMLPFRFHLGGHLGGGRQWLSWISLQDEVRAIRFLIEHKQIQGVVNLTAPEPVTMKAFCRTLGEILDRSAWMAVPAVVLRLMFGEMAHEVLLNGQRVVPKRLMEEGFEFLHGGVYDALAAIVRGEDYGSA